MGVGVDAFQPVVVGTGSCVGRDALPSTPPISLRSSDITDPLTSMGFGPGPIWLEFSITDSTVVCSDSCCLHPCLHLWWSVTSH